MGSLSAAAACPWAPLSISALRPPSKPKREKPSSIRAHCSLPESEGGGSHPPGPSCHWYIFPAGSANADTPSPAEIMGKEGFLHSIARRSFVPAGCHSVRTLIPCGRCLQLIRADCNRALTVFSFCVSLFVAYRAVCSSRCCMWVHTGSGAQHKAQPRTRRG